MKEYREFQRAIATQKFSYGAYRKSPATGRHILACALPVYDATHKMVGTLIAGFRLDQYEDVVNDIQLPPYSTIYMADEDGVRLFNRHYPDPKHDVYPLGERIRANVWQDIVARAPGVPFSNIGADGRRRLYTVQKLTNTNGDAPYFYVGVSILEEEILSEPKQELRKNLLLLAVAGFVSLLIAFYAGTLGFVRRIEALGKVAKAYASGVYSERTGGVGGNDEISQLGKDIDQIGTEAERQFAEIKQAQEALCESERRYRALFSAVSDPVLVANRDTGILVECNPAAEVYFGRSREQLIGLPQRELHPPESCPSEGVSEEFEHQVANPSLKQEVRLLAAGGEVRFVDVTARTFEIGESKLLLGVFRDVTEQRQAGEALRESELRFRALFSAVSDPVLVADRGSGILVECNGAAERFFGRSREQLVGLPQRDLHPPGTLQVGGVTEDFKRVTTDPMLKQEIKLLACGGDVRDVEVTASTFEIMEHKLILGVFRDITERIRKDNEILLAKEQAEAASKTKSEFLANMSHEIRTPLNGVLGMLQLLETTEPNAEQKEYLLGAIRSTNRLTRLLSDILDISRIESGRMEIVDTEFEIKGVWDSIQEVFEMEARGKGLRLEFGHDEDLSRVLIGDEARLRQILFNLVGNAIKFTERGDIRIDASLLPSTSESSVRVLTTVCDTGIGIPDEHLQGIFEPFVQAEASYTRRFQGAGLGLSIVRRLVKLMSGDISIESTVGKGTTFYLSLPFKLPLAEQKSVATTPDGGPIPSQVSLRILIAEDDSVSSLTCKRMLEKSGYSVTIAKDGQEALQRLTEQDFDLILMDVQMPVMDGVEATKTIRGASNLGTKSSIPIIAMTAYAMSGDKETFLAAGMDDYIAKPVDKAALVEVIERVMAAKRTSQ